VINAQAHVSQPVFDGYLPGQTPQQTPSAPTLLELLARINAAEQRISELERSQGWYRAPRQTPPRWVRPSGPGEDFNPPYTLTCGDGTASDLGY
jgi:hypothetical protein